MSFSTRPILVTALIISLLATRPDVASAAEPDQNSLARQLPRIPPVEPGKALSTFTVQHGFRL